MVATSIDWKDMFSLDVSLLEVILRGSIVYLGIFLILRAVLRRQSGTVTTSDLLLIVLIGDASQNAMVSDHRSVTSGLLLVGTLLFWDYALDWVSFRFPRVRSWIHPKPLLLVERGNVIEAHLAKELLTREQLDSKLREHGVDQLSEVRKACLEGDGRFSVITRRRDARSDDTDEPPVA